MFYYTHFNDRIIRDYIKTQWEAFFGAAKMNVVVIKSVLLTIANYILNFKSFFLMHALAMHT